jgi:hypothetical protein
MLNTAVRAATGAVALAFAACAWGTAPVAQSAGAAADRPARAESAEPLRVEFSALERTLHLQLMPELNGPCEVRIATEGVSRPEVGADVNEPGAIYLPPDPRGGPESDGSAAQNVYFFNEFSSAEGWDLIVHFAPAANGRWKLNGRFSSLGGEQSGEIAIAWEALEHGENLLHLSGAGRSLDIPEMYWRRRFLGAGPAKLQLRTFANTWGGVVSCWRADASGTWSKTGPEHAIEPTSLPSRPAALPEAWWTQPRLLEQALLAVGENVVKSQIQNRRSPFSGGFCLVYDVRRRSSRIEHWIWSWGPAIDLLLRLSKLERAGARQEEFRRVALEAAKRSLDFEVTAPNHPARGLSTVRWEPSRATPLGWAEYVSAADSLFLAGWGWMSAFAETGDAEYLHRTEQLVAATQRLMGEYPVVPQDWIVERERWTPHTLDESVFGMAGFERLHQATHSPEVAEAGRRFLESHLRHMGRASGTLARAWLRDEQKDLWDPDIKGHAWVVAGYLDAYQLCGDARYLRLARELAEKVIDCQSPSGAWTYGFKRPGADDPLDDKGTAIWAYFLYRLHHHTGEARYLDAARRALGWCLRMQYLGEDVNLQGALLNTNSMAYVRRRPMTILYSTTFFGLALLEEWRRATALTPDGSASSPSRTSGR